ncbi:hypothetical protein FD41_GL001408 [Lentilactobacillus farraginis DSM 18382 = JCM 14108]|nr:hypothetical protein FD41_GL001408 [Lentilactobacillus farraginis DSM 18382 = JCM 14108]
MPLNLLVKSWACKIINDSATFLLSFYFITSQTFKSLTLKRLVDDFDWLAVKVLNDFNANI